MGTSEEFGNDNNDGKLQDENTLINPKSPYGCAKAAARYFVNTYKNSYNLYALQGWTFNFESELRGDKYVTKKITQNVARIYNAIKNNQSFEPLELGNLDSHRSWQFCGDVVDGIWRQLNQEKYQQYELWDLFYNDNVEEIKYYSKKIKQYVMSARNCHTVREFTELSFLKAGFDNLLWDGEGIDEKLWFKDKNENSHILMKINPQYFRPHDVSYLNGDPSLIQKELGWKSTLSFEQLVERMVKSDISDLS